MGKKKERPSLGGIKPWVLTYGDMMTLLLCFFVALFDPSDVDSTQIQMMISSVNNIGMGASSGGTTMSSGKMADLGNTVASLPSMEKGKSLGTSLKKAVSLFNPEIKSNKVRVTHDERGLVISLAADAFFGPASADINIEDTRDMLVKLAGLLKSDEFKDNKFKIEGHTDSEPVAPGGKYASNWELSTARSNSVLRVLSDFGVNEKQFEVSGFADTVPLVSNDTPEGRAYNRRVDIVILDSGHL
jgi:chemotaxis protein MotB